MALDALTATVTAILPWSTPTAAPPGAPIIAGQLNAAVTAIFAASQTTVAEAGADPTTVIMLITITGNTLAAPVTLMQRVLVADAEANPPGSVIPLSFGAAVAPVANAMQIPANTAAPVTTTTAPA